MVAVASFDDLINALPGTLNLKARSLLMTIWGDSVAPHGGTVWLGSLIELVRCLGLNERVVRTSVFRLKQEKLLTSEQEGRRSFYTLTQTGQHRFEEATKRIYNYQPQPWNGDWTLLFTERRELTDDKKRHMLMELGWLGFGDLGSGIHAHPNCSLGSVQQLLADLDLERHVAVMTARSLPESAETPAHVLVQKGWNLAEIESGYTEFIDHFSPLMTHLAADIPSNPKKCFIIRTLLVHDYRRALLRDPMLPQRLLPDIWNGVEAWELFRSVYQAVWQGAEEYLLAILEAGDGKSLAISPEFSARFGGLTQQGQEGRG